MSLPSTITQMVHPNSVSKITRPRHQGTRTILLVLRRYQTKVPFAHASDPLLRLRVDGYCHHRLGVHHPINHQREREPNQFTFCRHRRIRDSRLCHQCFEQESRETQEPSKTRHDFYSCHRLTRARHFVDRQPRPRLQSTDGHDVRRTRCLRHRFHTYGLESNKIRRIMK